MSMEYYKRIIDAELNDQLDAMGAVFKITDYYKCCQTGRISDHCNAFWLLCF